MIGIFGGNFDPVHNGHVHIATQVLARLELEQLQFMPCALPVHRERPVASPAQRSAMLAQVIALRPEFSLNTLELDRGGPSYSIDSLRQIRAQNDAALVLLLGGDAFNGFAGWKLPREILALASLAVCVRPGVEVDADLFREHRVGSVAEFRQASAGAILVLEVDAPDCSSSSLRAALDAGEIPVQWLPAGVARYIENHQLYRRPGD